LWDSDFGVYKIGTPAPALKNPRLRVKVGHRFLNFCGRDSATSE